MRHLKGSVWMVVLAVVASACTGTLPGGTVPPTPAPDVTVTPPPVPGATLEPTAGVPTGPLLLFSREGGVAGYCDEITLSAEGVLAYHAPCSDANVEAQAPDVLMDQVRLAAGRLAPINIENEDNPGGPDNLKIRLVFNGTGSVQATPEDLIVVRGLAEQLMAWIREQIANSGPTPVGTPGPGGLGLEAICIQTATVANGSVHVAGEAEPTFEQNLVVRVFDLEGNELAMTPTTMTSEAGQRGDFSADLPVSAPADTLGRVEVSASSPRDGGITHLSTAELRAGAFRPCDGQETISIQAPVMGMSVSGSLSVIGVSSPTFEQTLLVQLFDESGQPVVEQVTHIGSDVGQRGPFSAILSLDGVAPGPARLVVSSSSARDGGLEHLASVEVLVVAP